MKLIFVFLLIFGCSSQVKNVQNLNDKYSGYINIDNQQSNNSINLQNPPDSSGFTYSSYYPINLDEFVERGDIEDETKGLKFFNSKNRIILNLVAYPTKDLSSDDIGRRNAFTLMYPNLKSIIHIYDSKLKVKYKDQYLLILFQSQLIPYLRSEVNLNDLVGFYFVHATFDDFSKIHLLLVNEFKKL